MNPFILMGENNHGMSRPDMSFARLAPTKCYENLHELVSWHLPQFIKVIVSHVIFSLDSKPLEGRNYFVHFYICLGVWHIVDKQ